jgi:hypothetical protein
MWLCAVPLRGAAQPSDEAAVDAATQQARDAFQAGKSALEQGQLEVALSQFQLADQTVASPNAKLMIGRCLAQLGRLAEAHATYGAAIREARASADGRYEQAAQAAATEQLALEPRLALVTVQVSDAIVDATLSVAGRDVPRAAWSQPIAVDPGAFEVVLRGPAGASDSNRLALQAGSAATVELTLAAQAQARDAAAQTTLAPAPARVAGPELAAAPVTRSQTPDSATASSLRTWSYVAGAVGAVGVASFAMFGAMSNAAFSDLDQACPERTACAPELRDEAERGRSYQTVANVSLAVGIAALGTGVALWVLGTPDDEVQVAVGAASVHVRGAL